MAEKKSWLVTPAFWGGWASGLLGAWFGDWLLAHLHLTWH